MAQVRMQYGSTVKKDRWIKLNLSLGTKASINGKLGYYFDIAEYKKIRFDTKWNKTLGGTSYPGIDIVYLDSNKQISAYVIGYRDPATGIFEYTFENDLDSTYPYVFFCMDIWGGDSANIENDMIKISNDTGSYVEYKNIYIQKKRH